MLLWFIRDLETPPQSFASAESRPGGLRGQPSRVKRSAAQFQANAKHSSGQMASINSDERCIEGSDCGRQGKSTAFGVAYVVGMIEILAEQPDTACQPFYQNVNDINGPSGIPARRVG
jgi:hypothetical protein